MPLRLQKLESYSQNSVLTVLNHPKTSEGCHCHEHGHGPEPIPTRSGLHKQGTVAQVRLPENFLKQPSSAAHKGVIVSSSVTVTTVTTRMHVFKFSQNTQCPSLSHLRLQVEQLRVRVSDMVTVVTVYTVTYGSWDPGWQP